MLRPSHDFYSTPARLQTKAKFRSDNSEFSSARPFAGTHAGRLSLSEPLMPMPGSFSKLLPGLPSPSPGLFLSAIFPNGSLGEFTPSSAGQVPSPLPQLHPQGVFLQQAQESQHKHCLSKLISK